jgi:hypothetical protein
MKRATITITDEDLALALKLGNGNLSRGVRILAERQRGRKLTREEWLAYAEALADMAEPDPLPFDDTEVAEEQS